MGTFLYLTGDTAIPEDKIDEFERILELAPRALCPGGMMALEDADLFGNEAYLMKPLENNGFKCQANINYFEDMMHEEAGYSFERHHLFSNKLGYMAFSRVMLLGYLLQELYSGGRCLVRGDMSGNLIEYTSWLNRELGTNFNLDHRLDLCNTYHVIESDEGRAPSNIDDLQEYHFDYSPESLGKLMDEYLASHTTEETIQFFTSHWPRGSGWMIALDRITKTFVSSVERFRKESKMAPSEQIDHIMHLYSMPCKRYENENDNTICGTMIMLPRESMLRILARIYEVTLDSIEAEYADLIRGWEPPILAMDAQDGGTAKRIAEARTSLHDIVCIKSDDERAHWWGRDCGFDLSDGFREWMRQIHDEHQTICDEVRDGLPSCQEKIKDMLGTLSWIDRTYHWLYMFKSSFYKIVNDDSVESFAAFELLRRIARRNEPSFDEYVEKHDSYQDAPARMEVKHYLAVLSNNELCREVFSF